MGDETGGLSSTDTLITIWLTIISGTVLLSLARYYWREAFTPLLQNIPVVSPTKLPPWMKFGLGITFLFVAIMLVIVGGKATFTYVSEPVLRVQVFLAAFLSVYWIWHKLVNAGLPAHWGPTVRLMVTVLAATVMVLSMVAYTEVKCPTSWSRHWWVPCL